MYISRTSGSGRILPVTPAASGQTGRTLPSTPGRVSASAFQKSPGRALPATPNMAASNQRRPAVSAGTHRTLPQTPATASRLPTSTCLDHTRLQVPRKSTSQSQR